MPITRNDPSAIPAELRYAKRVVRPYLFPALVSLSAIPASFLILQFAPAPFFWMLLAWAAALWVAIFCVRGSWPRAILFNLGIVACMVAGVEAYLITHEYTPRIFTPGFMVPDDALGWAPAKGMQATAMEAVRSGLFHRPVGKISDTRYTIDSNGLRIAPHIAMTIRRARFCSSVAPTLSAWASMTTKRCHTRLASSRTGVPYL